MTSQKPAASVREDFPHAVVEIENVFIPMSDGCRIAARIWLPATAHDQPVPAILEYIPYRKRDFMRARDEPIHRYFAGYGYAAVRVDVRGSGDSEGVLVDEYSDQEHRDALEIIDWLAEQTWCDGQVGMMGISWGGFNALQVAALRPPHLKAIITLCSTDDRYADDAHYMGGCLLNENMQWGAMLMTHNALPPDPRIVGARWRAMWLERLQHAVAFPVLWMQHPWRDHYWKRGSVCEDFAAIRCPVYAVGGWADGYTNAAFRLVENLSCPKKALIGPWSHVFPHAGVPGPAIGFLQEALRWWDHWLRGRETGIMDEPVLRVWLQESVPPQPQYDSRPGRWVAETEWPSTRIEHARWYLNPGRLSPEPKAGTRMVVSSPQSTGMAGGEWCAFGSDGEMPSGQRLDDGRSLSLDGEPLSDPIEILGAPVVELDLTVDTPTALVAVRLNDVAPDGASTRVTYGLLNLCHRESHEHPEPLVHGRRYRVRIQLNDVAHAFPAGHRLRLAISTAYWPIAWPPPRATRLTIFSGKSTLSLPVRPPRAGDESLRPFEPPEAARGPQQKLMRPIPLRRTVQLDLPTGEMIYTLDSDAGEFGGHEMARLEDIELDLGYRFTKRLRIADDDPLTAKTEIVQTVKMRRGDWAVRLESRAQLAAQLDHLHFTAEIQAFEGDEPLRTLTWDERVPRRLF
jgi:uncharacterized protein